MHSNDFREYEGYVSKWITFKSKESDELKEVLYQSIVTSLQTSITNEFKIVDPMPMCFFLGKKIVDSNGSSIRVTTTASKVWNALQESESSNEERLQAACRFFKERLNKDVGVFTERNTFWAYEIWYYRLRNELAMFPKV
jgi:hypothetical protein